MKEFLLSWLILSVAVWVTAALLPGIRVRGFWGAVVAAAVFGVLSWLIGWLLFVLIGIATLGLGFLLAFLTRWVVYALLLQATAGLTDRLRVQSFGWALGGALMMSAIGTGAEYLLQHFGS